MSTDEYPDEIYLTVSLPDGEDTMWVLQMWPNRPTAMIGTLNSMNLYSFTEPLA